MGGEFGTIRHAGLARHLDTRARRPPASASGRAVDSVPAGRFAVASRRAIGRVQFCLTQVKPSGGSPPLPWQPWRTLQAGPPLASPPQPLQALSCRARARNQRVMPPAPPPRDQEDGIPAALLSNDNVPASHTKLDVTTVRQSVTVSVSRLSSQHVAQQNPQPT